MTMYPYTENKFSQHVWWGYWTCWDSKFRSYIRLYYWNMWYLESHILSQNKFRFTRETYAF